jgi:hypothetical protein
LARLQINGNTKLSDQLQFAEVKKDYLRQKLIIGFGRGKKDHRVCGSGTTACKLKGLATRGHLRTAKR